MTSSFPSSASQRAGAILLGCALSELFPSIILCGYDLSDSGFSYDFMIDLPISEAQFPQLEELMRSLTKQDLPIRWTEMQRDNAANLFEHREQEVLADLAANYPDKIIPIMHMGEHYQIGAELPFESSLGFPCVKLLQLKENEEGLWQIQGIAAADKQELKALVKQIDAYKKFNATILASEMRLVADDSSLWLPKGARLRHMLFCQLAKDLAESFQSVHTTSDNLHAVMTQHSQLFAKEQAYTHTTPLKFFEIVRFSTEISSQQNSSLLRPNVYAQDIETIFCNEGQLLQQVISSLQFMDKNIKIIGFRHQWHLNLKEPKGQEARKNWKKGSRLLEQALKSCEFEYTVTDEETADLGLTIELKILDYFGRGWSGAFLTLDFSIMENLFKKKAVTESFCMVVQSCLGPIERCIGLMLEQQQGKLPFRLVPEQVRILLVSEKKLEYAKEVQVRIEQAGFRASVDTRPGKLSGKIHSAEMERIPFMVLIGEKEEVKDTLTVRSCDQEKNETIKLDEFITLLKSDDPRLCQRSRVES